MNAISLKTIRLLTFKGCQPAVELLQKLEYLIQRENLPFRVEFILVPSEAKASTMGLHGAPTILIDGVEVQADRRGPPGLYLRAYQTRSGFRPYPSLGELAALLKGDLIPRGNHHEVGDPVKLPVLLTANWCAFTQTAVNIYRRVKKATGRSIRILDAESKEGERLILQEGIAGIPCLVAAPGKCLYSLTATPAEAIAFLKEFGVFDEQGQTK